LDAQKFTGDMLFELPWFATPLFFKVVMPVLFMTGDTPAHNQAMWSPDIY